MTTAGTNFTPSNITIATGATVTWTITGATHNVTFGISKPAGGDIPDTPSGGSASRTFSASGTFPYQCTRHSGMTGQVTVQDSGTVTAPAPTTPGPGDGTVVTALAGKFTPDDVDIPPGGKVTWEFVGVANGIIFKDRAPSGGNVAEAPAGTRVSRVFSAVGDYDYYSTRDKDVKGRVRVR
ncbi:MAG: plastocyanin/azurin family copper-binding protein [Gemmatimonadaceae bacterium]